MSNRKNVSYSLKDNNTKNTNVTYESLIEKVNNEATKIDNNFFNDEDVDYIIACELEYRDNYTKPQLEIIAEYYNIPKKENRRVKRKDKLIEDIVIFEKDITNYDIVQRRKTLWFYIEEIRNDSYLSKFLILD